MRASGYSSRSSLYRGLFENGGKSPEQGAECELEELRVLNAVQTLRVRRGPGTNQGLRNHALLAALLGSACGSRRF